MHVMDLYATDPSMFELNGKHLKSAFGKDMLDHFIACAESGMVRVSLDGDVRAAEADNRLAIVEGRVDLVRRDLARNSQRLDVVAARGAEESEAAQNEKYVLLCYCYILSALLFSRFIDYPSFAFLDFCFEYLLRCLWTCFFMTPSFLMMIVLFTCRDISCLIFVYVLLVFFWYVQCVCLNSFLYLF